MAIGHDAAAAAAVIVKGLVVLLMVGVSKAGPVRIPTPPRLSNDDPYAHNLLEEDVTPTPVYLPTPPPGGYNFTTPAPKTGSTLHAVKFMQQFGYIPKPKNNADFIFTAHALEKAITKMQKFGDIPQTGIIDNATIELMQTPRCGLPDVEPEDIANGENHIRRKRYILGSEGWRKRKLTYFVANWSPKLWSIENVKKELRKAFDAWSTYSHLQFTEVPGPEADIVIFFASYDHYDGYPFDGPSGILAHAYYPYEFGHYGGDVHFDESEDWTIDPKDEYSGLDFFTVAVHEIGHSLGLSHSPVSGSIMFPYYKGYNTNFALDYDDVMAMWELYIKRKLEGDDEYFNSTTTTTTTTQTPTTEDDEHQSDAASDDNDDEDDDGDGDEVYKREEEEKKRREEEEERRRWEEEIRKREAENRRREEEERRRWENEEGEYDTSRNRPTTTEKPPPPLPNLCYGSYDAVAVLRQELFIFKGEYLWRYNQRGSLRPGYPSLIRSLFSALPTFMKRVDAVYERQTDSSIVFFIGKYYYVHNGDRLIEDSPRPISSLGLPDLYTRIDAAFYWPRAKKTYFFSHNSYFRYDDATKKMDDGYPKDMKKWNGIPGELDAVFTWTDDASYFLRGYQYWKYDNVNIRPDEGYPKDATHFWADCPVST